VYEVDGVVHYAVDNTPAMFPKTVSRILSAGISGMVDALAEGKMPKNLKPAVVIQEGRIMKDEILKFRQERGLYCG